MSWHREVVQTTIPKTLGKSPTRYVELVRCCLMCSCDIVSTMLAYLILLEAIILSAASTRPSLSDLWRQHSFGPVIHRWLEFSNLYQEVLESYNYGAKRLVML